MKASRLVTTTILGAVFGVICMLATRYTAEVDFWPIGVAFLLHHTVLGFTIGASSLKMHWAAHGAFWGALFGVFLAIIGVDIYPDPWQLFVIPVIWGFLIETLATKAFKQPQPR
jgi:uncharacterized membrane protein